MRITVVGGAGRVGLPLSVLLAKAGHRVDALDTDSYRVDSVKQGIVPFKEDGLDELLHSVLANAGMRPTVDYSVIADAEVVFVVVGTDLNAAGDPQNDSVFAAIDRVREFLSPETLVVLRSTVMPGTTEMVQQKLRDVTSHVAYCPERIAEGQAVREMSEIPQLVGCNGDDATFEVVSRLFSSLEVECVRVSIREAELGKLILNAWRYAQFAFGNEFARLCESNGVNFSNVLSAIRHRYPRADGLKSAGLAGGPCLEKDTRQLLAASDRGSRLLEAVVATHEEVLVRVMNRVERLVNLPGSTVALLGLTFKPGSDDLRGSPAVELAERLRTRAKSLLVVDPHVVGKVDYTLVALDEALRLADVVVIGTHHEEFRGLKAGVSVVDAADCFGSDI